MSACSAGAVIGKSGQVPTVPTPLPKNALLEGQRACWSDLCLTCYDGHNI